jgi:glycine cleavage system H protein
MSIRFTKDHEYIRLEGDTGVVGITDYAQQQLGDVVFVELPQVGRVLAQGEVFGTIESVKAVSELFSPVAGEIVAVNDALTSAPEQVNSEPHAAWIIRVRPTNQADLETLLDAAAYEQHVG